MADQVPPQLRLLARLLPPAFVDRVVAPAYGDLVVELGRRPGLLRLGRFAVSALWTGAPAVVWRGRRPTAVGGAILVVVVAIAVVAYLRSSDVYAF